ncbi:hypothetical protein FOMPIDRAFT_100977 [Fomitopsis schrenkii]|uniref:F-box domain-containing protein n=1 Tax=Fomitopsis schrenkii TaxID=2126942 RepID=S8EF07_FOMSC|nr:hypothetical protein FOMPIDRAFT_100977 [Fomitopsis schrenkii]
MSQSRVDVVHGYSRTPLEVLEVIITSTDDGPSLARWSLVSRVWSVIARKQRFRTVTISAREDGFPLAASLLCDPTSAILPFVRRIRFEEGIDLENLYEHDHRISRYIKVDHGTPFLDDILSAIRIVDLANLQSLEIVDLTWAEISEGSRRSFIKLWYNNFVLDRDPRGDHCGVIPPKVLYLMPRPLHSPI